MINIKINKKGTQYLSLVKSKLKVGDLINQNTTKNKTIIPYLLSILINL